MIDFKKFYKRINFDIDYQIKESFTVKQNDTSSRGFYVKIIQQNKVVRATKNEKLTFFGRKQDGTYIFVDAELENGEFRIDLPNQTFSVPGVVIAEFSLRGSDNEIISTKDFTIKVQGSFPVDEAIESENDFTALQQALAQIANFAGKLESSETSIDNIIGEVGQLTDLETLDKKTIVSAINEIRESISNILNSEELNLLLKTKADKEDLGDLLELTTEQKENLVGAINEIKAELENVQLITDTDELISLVLRKANKSELGNISDLETEEKENLVGAINEIVFILNSFESLDIEFIEDILNTKANNEVIGDLVDLTTVQKDSLVNAINEIALALKEVESITNIDELSLLLSRKANKSDLGNLLELNTEQKESLVVAINEIHSLTSQSGQNLGSISSDTAIINKTTEHMSQVNTSTNSSAGENFEGWLINIEDKWVFLDFMEAGIYGDFETEYLVDDGFVFANIYDYGDYISMMVETKEMGLDMGLELYHVKEGTININDAQQVNASHSSKAIGQYSQINVSYNSEASGTLSQVNASQESEASGTLSQVNASQESEANGYTAQVNASSNSKAIGTLSQVNASQESEASGTFSQVNASQESEASGTNSQVNASSKSEAMSGNSQVNASINTIAGWQSTQVNSSRYVRNNTAYSTALGYELTGNVPSTSNIKIHLLSQTGDIKNSGVVTSGHNFTDYAELFPNLTREAQGYGLIQTIDGHGVRPAEEGEQIVGVTSATAGIILGETPFSWQGRWLKDEWGAYITEDVWDEDVEKFVNSPKENPEWDAAQVQITRQDRPEDWTVVGLMGQVYVRLEDDVKIMDYVKPSKNGVGQRSEEQTNLRVMEITKEYDKDKGYKIGFCFLK